MSSHTAAWTGPVTDDASARRSRRRRTAAVPFATVDRPPERRPRRPIGRVPGRTVVIVMPAYNAAKTLERTYADIPHDLVDRIILVDDVSRDETVEIARQLGLDVIIHQPEPGLRRQPEDVLRRGARGRAPTSS